MPSAISVPADMMAHSGSSELPSSSVQRRASAAIRPISHTTALRFKPFQNSYLSQAEQMYCAGLSHRVQILSASSAIEAAVVRSEYYRGTGIQTLFVNSRERISTHSHRYRQKGQQWRTRPSPCPAWVHDQRNLSSLAQGQRLAPSIYLGRRQSPLCDLHPNRCAPLRRRRRRIAVSSRLEDAHDATHAAIATPTRVMAAPRAGTTLWR